MSGGIAYVLDNNDTLKDLYNPQMVELESILENKNYNQDEFIDNHLFNDAARLQKLIMNHLHYTNSNVAEEIINNFSDFLTKFKKVMPIEYKKVLQENLEKDQNENKLAKLG